MEFSTQSGVSVVISVAPWKDAMGLKNAIERELVKSGQAMSEIKLSDMELGILAPLALCVDSSEEVYKALFQCLKRCTYNGESIIEKTFEPEEAREDYYEVAFACVKANVYPLVKRLISNFSNLSKKSPSLDSPTSK